MALRTRNAVLLAKIESTVGVDAAPTGVDAIKVENPKFTYNGASIDTNEVSGSLDSADPIPGGATCGISFDVYIKGSGTAGVAPEWGRLMKACGWSETATATAVPAAAEALAAGASATQATLGTTAAATSELYRGMPILFTGTVAGQSFIRDYTAAKLADLTDTLGGNLTTTTSYQILKNVLYQPSSATVSSLTMYLYIDGIRYVVIGCRGDVSMSFQSGQPGKLSFNFTGVYVGKTDQALPTPTYDAGQAPAWLNGKMLIQRVAAQVKALSLASNNNLVNPDDPNQLDGYGIPEITSRSLKGELDPLMTLVATRDAMGDFRNNTQRMLHARWGNSAGNRIALTVPSEIIIGASPEDRDGLVVEKVNFFASGRDSGAQLCIW